jgi:ankyrin repeat protein
MRIMRALVAVVTLVAASIHTQAQAPAPTASVHDAVRTNALAALRVAIAAQGPDARDTQGQTPLVLATAFGTLEAVQLLLEAGADPKLAAAGGITPLHVAARDIRKVRLLIDRGGDVNARSAAGATPLMVASATNGASGAVSLLIEKGARVTDRDSVGATALSAAAVADHGSAVRLLLDAGSDGSDPQALFGAAMNGNVETTRLLLARQPNVRAAIPDVPNTVKNGPIQFGRVTALHFAVAADSPDIARLLLDAGAPPNVADMRGLTPLAYAIATDRPNLALIRMLKAAGGDLTVRGTHGDTPLDWARKFNDAAVLGELNLHPSPVAAHRPTNGEASVPSAQRAVERSVALLRTSSARVMSDGGCVACHAQPMAAMASSLAEKRGWHVEGPATSFAQSLMAVSGSLPLNLQARVPGGWEVQLFIAMMLADQGAPATAGTDSLLYLLAARQRDEGNWQGGNGGTRAPMQDGDFARTAMAIRAMAAYATPALQAEFDARVQRAATWLAAEGPVSTEDRIWQLLGLTWARGNAAGLAARAEKLIALQRPDGGWGQTPHLPSDAYATGQAIYALRKSGVDVPGSVVAAASAFLLGTQAADGSWHVVNRAMKFQPYFESGFPYAHDQWISQMGTAWAAMALATLP